MSGSRYVNYFWVVARITDTQPGYIIHLLCKTHLQRSSYPQNGPQTEYFIKISGHVGVLKCMVECMSNSTNGHDLRQ